MVDEILPQFAEIRQDAPCRTYTRARICIDCGTVDAVYKWSKSERCRPCAGRATASNTARVELVRSRGAKEELTCPGCHKPFLAYKKESKRHCSHACMMVAKRATRSCKECNAEFQVLRSKLSGKSNSSGNFCCRPCYEAWLCRTDHEPRRGAQWKKVRAEAIRRAPFCAICSTQKNLQVHHIVPWRITKDNRQCNLIPLCTKHHKSIEMIFIEVERQLGPDWEAVRLVLGGQLLERQTATRFQIVGYLRERRAAAGRTATDPLPAPPPTCPVCAERPKAPAFADH